MKRACVIGWPVAHSLSPVIHNFWLQENRLDGSYVKEAVEPMDLAPFLAGLAGLGYCGANVTVPHKVEAYRLCERLDGAAEAIGAVNTIWFEAGRLTGSNTDAFGFTANLDCESPGWDRAGPALVIGAGGAARAVLWALVQRGFDDIRIVNRTKKRGQELAHSFPPARAFGFEGLTEALQNARFAVNASTLAMAGSASLDIDLSSLSTDATVCDIVYHPLETPLLRQARDKGFQAVDGLGMLLHQAVPGFERWFGIRPIVTSRLRETVLAAVRARESSQA